MKVYILRGLPGSGKSTFVKTIGEMHPFFQICSADKYFLSVEGEYQFDPGKLADAHAYCQRDFHQVVTDRRQHHGSAVVVDNTNLSAVDYSYYATLAEAFNHEVEFITFLVDPSIAFQRNVHGVPESAYPRLQERLERGTHDLPDRWNHIFLIQ